MKSFPLGPQSEHASILRSKANRLLLSRILTFGVAFVVIGCQPSLPNLDSSNAATRLRAVQEVVTDQTVLAGVAVEDEDRDVRLAAVEKLADQDLLAGIALGQRVGISVREAAVDKLTDYGVLAKVTLVTLGGSLSSRAATKLPDDAALANLASTTEDADIRDSIERLLQVFAAIDGLPGEHKYRLMTPILRVAGALAHPTIASEVKIASIRTQWDPISWPYSAGRVPGERFTMTFVVVVQNETQEVSHTWETDFPATLPSLRFRSAIATADGQIPDVLEDMFSNLSQSKLAEIALGTRRESLSAREAAVRHLTDQDLLAKVVVEAVWEKPSNRWTFEALGMIGGSVRVAAARKLADQDLLSKVAVEDEDADVRRVAVEKLTDQGLLAEVAVGDADADVRRAAVEKLTDNQDLLSTVAVQDKDAEVRILAVANLTDQGLLAQIAMDDGPRIGRIAVERLTDQALLAQVAEDGHYEVREDAVRRLEFLRSSEKEPQLEQRN